MLINPPKMDEEEKKALISQYSDDIGRLEAEIDKKRGIIDYRYRQIEAIYRA